MRMWKEESLPELQEAEEEARVQQILDSKYEKQDLTQLAQQQKHLTPKQQAQLQHLLDCYADAFLGKLGAWLDERVDVELLPNSTPYHCKKPMRISHVHLATLRKEIERLISVGVIECVDGATAGPWCAPSFIVPKKDGRVRFVTDYRELNRNC